MEREREEGGREKGRGAREEESGMAGGKGDGKEEEGRSAYTTLTTLRRHWYTCIGCNEKKTS